MDTEPAPDAVSRMPKWKRDYLSRCFGVSMESEEETAKAPDALAAMREALNRHDNRIGEADHEPDLVENRKMTVYADHHLALAAVAHLPALLDELERLRTENANLREARFDHPAGKGVGPMEEVVTFPNGYTLYRRNDEVGGRDYFSDEIDGGVHVWNTSLVTPETMRAAWEAEYAAQRTRCSISFPHPPHDWCDGNPDSPPFGSELFKKKEKS